MQIIEPSHEILGTIDPMAILARLEECGRTAYKSEDQITPFSALKFIAAIVKREHESVLEHVSLSVRFICDRGVTHELVRHRLAAYTQESTRFCNYAKKGVTFIEPCFWKDHSSEMYTMWLLSMGYAEEHYNWLMEHGATAQQARSVLPNSLKTEIVCTANLREWRHILRLRTSKDAHPQMRELMVPLLKELRSALPVLFNDVGSVEE